MAHEIRKHMALVDGDNPLSSDFEADEAYVGGKHSGKRARGADGKPLYSAWFSAEAKQWLKLD